VLVATGVAQIELGRPLKSGFDPEHTSGQGFGLGCAIRHGYARPLDGLAGLGALDVDFQSRSVPFHARRGHYINAGVCVNVLCQFESCFSLFVRQTRRRQDRQVGQVSEVAGCAFVLKQLLSTRLHVAPLTVQSRVRPALRHSLGRMFHDRSGALRSVGVFGQFSCTTVFFGEKCLVEVVKSHGLRAEIVRFELFIRGFMRGFSVDAVRSSVQLVNLLLQGRLTGMQRRLAPRFLLFRNRLHLLHFRQLLSQSSDFTLRFFDGVLREGEIGFDLLLEGLKLEDDLFKNVDLAADGELGLFESVKHLLFHGLRMQTDLLVHHPDDLVDFGRDEQLSDHVQSRLLHLRLYV